MLSISNLRDERMKRLFSLLVMGGLLFAGGGFFKGGLNQQKLSELLGGLLTTTSGVANPNLPPPPRGNDTIRVASFNIQVFGEAKLNDADAMQAIVAILRN